jgi:hypothetical protein
MIKNLDKYPIVSDAIYTKEDLSKFERLLQTTGKLGELKDQYI